MNNCRRPICAESCATPPRAPLGTVHQLLRLFALLVTVGAGAVIVAAATAVPGYRRARRGSWALQLVARCVLRSIGVRRTVHGGPRTGPSLVVGNHISWLDILALSSCAPMVMVAKAEVSGWPIIGTAAARVNTIFLHRDQLRTLPDTVVAMTSALRSGRRVQVFPEGTTRCGGAVGQFHRAAFQAAIAAAVVVSPVTIGYTDGEADRITAPAFLGNESLVSSLRRVLATPRIEVTVRWLPPIPAIAGTGRDHLDRATVARLTEKAIADSFGTPTVHAATRTAVPSTVPARWSADATFIPARVTAPRESPSTRTGGRPGIARPWPGHGPDGHG